MKLKLCLKVGDQFNAVVVGDDGRGLYDVSGAYVPDFMPGEHCGDYVELDIDVETGMVTNWKKPTKKEVLEWANEHTKHEK